MRPLVLVLLIAVASPVRSAARAPAPVDSSLFRSFSNSEPYRSRMQTQNWASMDSLARARFDAHVAAREPDSLIVGRALAELVEVGCLAGRARGADMQARAERLLAMHTARPGPDSLILARSLRAVADVHRRRRELAEAEGMLQRALAIQERALPADDPEIVITARLLVTVGVNTGGRQYPELARRTLDASLKLFGPDDMRTLMSYSALAGVQNVLGDQVGALVNLEHVLAGMERQLGPDHPDVDRSRFNVAVVAMRVGDYVRALELLERAIEWEASRPVVDSLRLANSVGAAMEVLNDLRDYEGARAVDERFGKLVEQVFRVGDSDRYRHSFERARTFVGLGRGAEAVALFDSSAASEAQVNDSTSALPILFQRAGAYRVAGDSTAALRAIELAGRLADAAPERLDTFYEMGLLWARCLDDAGRPAEALAKLEPSLARCEQSLGPRNPMRAGLLLEKARALTDLADPRAFAVANEAAELTAELLRTAARGFPDRQALLYARGTGLGLDPLLVLAAAGRLDAGQRRAALERLVEARSLVLDEVGRRQRMARSAADPRGRALVDSLSAARGMLARWLLRSENDPQVDSLRRDARERGERLERRLAEFGMPSDRTPIATVPDVPEREALVSFVEYIAPTGGSRSERRLLAFITRGGREPEVVALGRAREVDALVSHWRADVARGVTPGAAAAAAERAARTSGAALRARVWDPIARHLAGVERARLVADGALHLVDFAALPARSGGYLAESGPLLARLGTERDLAPATSPVQPSEQLVAVGGADFDRHPASAAATPGTVRGPASVCAAFHDVRFASLPGTRQEAAEVANRWRASGRPALELTGVEADEARLKSAAAACGVLHIATHGFFLGGECTRETPATRGIGGLAPADASIASAATPGRVNALRLAGLALAGANQRDDSDSGDDGVLTAEEIATLDLSRVREVVLSACDSGVGDIAAGEGVLGLQRAFRLAGARSLVMSLWPVDDSATREWMDAYYAARIGGSADVAASVREAQRSRLRALRAAGSATPPAAWAGFIPLGD